MTIHLTIGTICTIGKCDYTRVCATFSDDNSNLFYVTIPFAAAVSVDWLILRSYSTLAKLLGKSRRAKSVCWTRFGSWQSARTRAQRSKQNSHSSSVGSIALHSSVQDRVIRQCVFFSTIYRFSSVCKSLYLNICIKRYIFKLPFYQR